MSSLWFVVPAQGRFAKARICFAQLRKTCDALADYGIEGNAVVAANDENFYIAREHGFRTVRISNQPLGRKINAAYEAAGAAGADFFAALGNDDWVDPAWVGKYRMPGDHEVRCARKSAIVNEDGTKLARLYIPYKGGDGVRIYPRAMLERFRFRPVEDDRPRGIDTSTLRKLSQEPQKRPTMIYFDLHPLQIVDFKEHTGQLNSYSECLDYLKGAELDDPFDRLAEHYPEESVEAMRSLYAPVAV